MSEQLRVKFHRFIEEVWNKGNLDVSDEVYAGDVVYHMPPFPEIEGLGAFKQTAADIRAAFPDLHVVIDEDIFDGNTSVHRWSVKGTYKGESSTLPSPPTGKETTAIGCHIYHWVDGKVTEAWHLGDWLGWLQRAGVIP